MKINIDFKVDILARLVNNIVSNNFEVSRLSCF